MPIIFTDSGTHIEESVIQALEEKLGMPLPPDYREFLLTHNGARLSNSEYTIKWPKGLDWDTDGSLHYLYPLGNEEIADMTTHKEWIEEYIPQETLPIGADGSGNEILLCLSGKYANEILFWDHEMSNDENLIGDRISDPYGALGFIAANFTDFINNLRPTED